MWTKVDDHLHSHVKVVECWRADRGALGLHLLALSHAGQAERDGWISEAFVAEKVPAKRERSRMVGVLVRVALWDAETGGWRIHDYLDANPSREEIRLRKRADQNRKALARNPSLAAIVRLRDGEHCRYCGSKVSFARRKEDGACYSIIDPGQPVIAENVVIACKRCREQIGALSAFEAGMALLPAPAPQLPLSARTAAGCP